MRRDAPGDDVRRRVEAAFERALEIEPARRRVWVDAACPDAAVRREVLALLAAHERTGGILEADPVAAAEALAQGWKPPERAGPYRLVSELGRGGMGVVYRAERDDGHFARQVAVKVLMASPYSLDLHRRFLVERQILASLDHPNIARLLDGGVTEAGHPYLVMELVEGEPITAYADRIALDIPSRLHLFLRVCDAVDYAHAHLVVHRDLKPSNILVTPAGTPKLLDFGIARLLDRAMVPGVTVPATRTGWRPMTPEYASPEQLRGENPGTASDVYSLGVVLYELLSGRRPFFLAGLSPAEAERTVLGREPTRPSSALPEDTPAASARRRRLRGDLDRITLHALRKEPERRYPSAGRLADDLQRHLSGHPVVARGDSAPYRARKFVTRHRWVVAAVGALLVSLAAGLAATGWQARRATLAAERAAAERDRAESEAGKASRVAGLLAGLLRLSDPTESRGDTVTVRHLLDEGAVRIDRELEGEPALQADLLAKVADIYANLGLLDRAEAMARRALALREDALGPGAPETAGSLAGVAGILVTRGRGPEAIPLYRLAVGIRERDAAEGDTVLARWRSELAWLLRTEGSADEAAGLFRAALAAQRGRLGPQRPELARTVLGLASVYHDAGRAAEAESLFALAAPDPSAPPGRPDPAVATALLAAGSLRQVRQDYAQAERFLRPARAMRQALYAADHPARIEADKEWATLLFYQGRYARAGAVARDALGRARRALGSSHPHAGTLREVLALVLTATGRYAEASSHYDTILAEKRDRYGPEHAQVTAALLRSAEPLFYAGRLDAAAGRWRDVLARSGGEGARSVFAARSLDGLARVAAAEGRPAEALGLLERADRTAAALLSPGHRWVSSIRRHRAAVLVDLGRPEEAIALVEPAVRADVARVGEPHPLVGRGLAVLGEALLAAGRPAEAEPRLRSALANLAGLPPSHWRVGAATALLGEALLRQGRTAEGNRLLREGMDAVRTQLGAGSPVFRRLSGRGPVLRRERMTAGT